MVQHVTIIPKPLNPTEPDAYPHTVDVWRDDQTIKWGLTEDFSWPNPIGDPVLPIVFLPATEEYHAWRGSIPTPIGPRPEPGTPDRRVYIASCDDILPPGAPPVKYHYMYAVCPVATPTCLATVDPSMTEAPAEQRWQDEVGHWHDPDVENQSQP